MTVLRIFITVAWGIRIIRNVLAYAALWYVKEYRFDRMWIHLRERGLHDILFIGFRRPRVSPKSIVLVGVSLSVLFLAYILYPDRYLIVLFFSDIASFPFISMLVLMLKAPTALYHEIIIWAAVRKLRSHAPMKIIGITGSYGKTSTKEMLATILSVRFKTLKTEASKNSPIGIAELIHKKLAIDHEAFVVEMGAYKTGEIARMCRMVQPQIGIVLSINAQHQDLFGSIENTMKAKYELIANLTGARKAVMNADNDRTRQMATWAMRDGASVQFYSVRSAGGSDLSVWADACSATKNGIRFTLHAGKKSRTFALGLLGAHQVSNILAAASAALESGLEFEDVCKGIARITPMEKTFELVATVQGTRLIDDTFNNNPDAAIAAIDYLALSPGRKILVFQPMIELGPYASESHKRVAARAAKVCDAIFLTNDSYYDDFSQAVHTVKTSLVPQVLDPKTGPDVIKAQVSDGATIVFKGKESARYLSYLKNM